MVEILGTLAVVAVVVAIGLWLDRRFGILPRPEQLQEADKPASARAVAFGPGEAPVAAIAVTDKQLAQLRVRRCADDRTELAPLVDDRVRYEGRELVVLRWRCPKCERATSLFVAPR